MATRILTPEFRAGYISVFKATAQKQDDGTMGKAKFSIRACFPPTADLSELKAEAGAAAVAKFGSNVPKSLRSPFRRNEELDNPVAGLGDDWIVMTFSANEDSKPGLVDADTNDIIDQSLVYSGAWYRCQVHAYGYDMKGNKGVTFGLDNVQKLRDDDTLGNGKPPANKAFTPVGAATGASGGKAKSAADIFG